MPYLKDPKDGKLSVTLTFLVISFLLVAGVSVAAVMGKATNSDSLLQLFYACAGLYFGRRVNLGTKSFGMDPVTTPPNKDNTNA